MWLGGQSDSLDGLPVSFIFVLIQCLVLLLTGTFDFRQPFQYFWFPCLEVHLFVLLTFIVAVLHPSLTMLSVSLCVLLFRHTRSLGCL